MCEGGGVVWICGMMGDMRVLNVRYLIEGWLMFFIFFSIYMYSRDTVIA